MYKDGLDIEWHVESESFVLKSLAAASTWTPTQVVLSPGTNGDLATFKLNDLLYNLHGTMNFWHLYVNAGVFPVMVHESAYCHGGGPLTACNRSLTCTLAVNITGHVTAAPGGKAKVKFDSVSANIQSETFSMPVESDCALKAGCSKAVSTFQGKVDAAVLSALQGKFNGVMDTLKTNGFTIDMSSSLQTTCKV